MTKPNLDSQSNATPGATPHATSNSAAPAGPLAGAVAPRAVSGSATPVGSTTSKATRPDVSDLRRQEEAGARVMAARNALRKGDRDRAREEIKQAFAISPGDVAAVDLLGDMLLEEGETEKALALYQRALQQHPRNPIFEEKLAICGLDLAEMENDRIAKTVAIDAEPIDKLIERVPHKAVSLSVLLPGAGQIYNEEIEKGIAFLVAGLIMCVGWFYPVATAMRDLRTSRDILDPSAIIRAMSPTSSLVFWASLTVWTVIYVASLIDAGVAASRYNFEQRKARGLES